MILWLTAVGCPRSSHHEGNLVLLRWSFYILFGKEGKQLIDNLRLPIVEAISSKLKHVSRLSFSWCEAELPHKQDLIPRLLEEPPVDQGPAGRIVWLQQSFWPAWSLSSFLPWGWALSCSKACLDRAGGLFICYFSFSFRNERKNWWEHASPRFFWLFSNSGNFF